MYEVQELDGVWIARIGPWQLIQARNGCWRLHIDMIGDIAHAPADWNPATTDMVSSIRHDVLGAMKAAIDAKKSRD